MILTEYDENEFRDFLKEEAWNEGHKAGIERGMRTGLIEGTIKTCMDFQAVSYTHLDVYKRQVVPCY